MQKRRYIRGCAALLLALWLPACGSTEVLSDHNLLDGKIMTVVHGCGGFETYRNTLPPNTIAAMQRSLAQGADAIEMDVQISADGQLVVFHDGQLEKMTTCVGCIHDQNWSPTQDCRYKTRHNSLDGSYPVPLLDSMLAAYVAAGSDAILFLNTKHDSPCDPGDLAGADLAFATRLVGSISHYGLTERVIVESWKRCGRSPLISNCSLTTRTLSVDWVSSKRIGFSGWRSAMVR